MIKAVGHLGIFVQSIEETLAGLEKLISFPEPELKEMTEVGMRCCVVDLGAIQLELLQEANPEGGLAKMLKEKGDYIDHFCLVSDDIDKDARDLLSKGVDLQNESPAVGLRGKKFVLTNPELLNGLTVEISEP